MKNFHYFSLLSFTLGSLAAHADNWIDKLQGTDKAAVVAAQKTLSDCLFIPSQVVDAAMGDVHDFDQTIIKYDIGCRKHILITAQNSQEKTFVKIGEVDNFSGIVGQSYIWAEIQNVSADGDTDTLKISKVTVEQDALATNTLWEDANGKFDEGDSLRYLAGTLGATVLREDMKLNKFFEIVFDAPGSKHIAWH